MLIQGDQSALAQAVHGIEQQFGLSDQVVGLIPLVMAACASIGAIPVGVLADRRRRTWVLAGVCALWAVGMGAGAIAPRSRCSSAAGWWPGRPRAPRRWRSACCPTTFR